MVYVLLVTSPVSVVLLLLWIAAQTVHHIVMLVYQLQQLHTDTLHVIFSHSDHSHINCRYELFTSLAVYREYYECHLLQSAPLYMYTEWKKKRDYGHIMFNQTHTHTTV